jgi:hypothetical protein
MRSDREILEDFILNNKELGKLESQLAQFNIFETLNAVKAEIRHSAVLAWLLQPSANHGCGEYFAKLFLKYIFSTNRNALDSKLSIFNFESFDYSDLEVRREWNNIDLLLVSEENKFVIVIENKIGSDEHSDQLKRYHDIVCREFPKHEKIFVFLTAEGETGSDERWLIFNYSTIEQILADLIEFKKSSLGPDVLSFLKQYGAILRRYVVANPEIEKICREIYKKHQPALDLIFQYKPDAQYDISQIVTNKIKASPKLILDISGKTYIRFTTKVFDDLIPRKGEGWTSTKRLVLFEFANYEKRLVLRFIIGPGPAELRKKLYDFSVKNRSLFNKAKNQPGEKWNTVYQENYLTPNDFDDLDMDVIRSKILKKIDAFLVGDLKKIETYFQENWKE